AAAQVEAVDGLPGKAHLGIGGGAKVTVMVIAPRQRQREALEHRRGIVGPEDRHEQFAVDRGDLASEVFWKPHPAARPALHVGLAAIFGAERNLEIPAGKMSQWPVD